MSCVVVEVWAPRHRTSLQPVGAVALARAAHPADYVVRDQLHGKSFRLPLLRAPRISSSCPPKCSRVPGHVAHGIDAVGHTLSRGGQIEGATVRDIGRRDGMPQRDCGKPQRNCGKPQKVHFFHMSCGKPQRAHPHIRHAAFARVSGTNGKCRAQSSNCSWDSAGIDRHLFTILWDPSAGQPSPSHEGRGGEGRRPRIGQPKCGASVRRAAASCCHTCLCAASRALARRCCCWLQRCCCFRLQRGAGAAGGRGRPRLHGKPREKRVNTARLICCTRPPSSLLPSERSHRSCRRSWASCSSKSSCYLSPSLPFSNTIS